MPDRRAARTDIGRFRIWVEDRTVTAMHDLRDYFDTDASRVFGLGIDFLHYVTGEKSAGRVILSVDPEALPEGFINDTTVKKIY